jgi:cyclic beta-1,2-glucan synthetase
VPGVRENGGQYSHAAIWALMAFASLGDREKVWELFSMIQPLNHSSNNIDIQVYKVEPYVMAADIYANELHKGRGGWTWYTGSSGWMYQFITGSFLGIELKTNQLLFKPCFPLVWNSVSIVYRFKTSIYKITVFQSDSKSGSCWEMDKSKGKGDTVKLIDDRMVHEVKVYICR